MTWDFDPSLTFVVRQVAFYNATTLGESHMTWKCLSIIYICDTNWFKSHKILGQKQGKLNEKPWTIQNVQTSFFMFFVEGSQAKYSSCRMLLLQKVLSV